MASLRWLQISTIFAVFARHLASHGVKAMELNATLDGALSTAGFHRTLSYTGKATLKSDKDVFKAEACKIMLQQQIPKDLYIDLDEMENKEKFRGPKVIADHPFKTEDASFESEEQTVILFPPVYQYDRGSIMFNLSVNIHVRYQMATYSSSNTMLVKLKTANLYVNCGEKFNKGSLNAACFGKWENQCKWLLIADRIKNLDEFTLEVPTGDRNKTPFIAMTTLSTAVISSVLIVLKTFSIW